MGNVNGIAANQRRKETMSSNDVALSAEDCRLFDAVERNDAEAAAAVQQAIRDGANVNAVRRDHTPLMEACRYGCDQIIRILLDAGADARWSDRHDGWSAIFVACSNGHFSTVQLLINHDKGLLHITDDIGSTPLMVAIRERHFDIVRLLLKRRVDPRRVDRYGKTALMTACESDSLETVRLLLAAGVNVEARERRQKHTALHKAVISGGSEIMRELILQHNANMFAVDKYGRTPFDFAGNTWRDVLEIYGNKLTQDHDGLALHELLKVAKYSFAEQKYTFHPPLNPLQILLPLGKLTLTHLRTLLHNLDPELIRNRDDTGKLPTHIACQTNAPLQVLALILELDPTTLHIADYTGALPMHLLCGTAPATEYASVRYLIQSFPGSVAVQTNAGDYPFMVAASDSSLASLSVIYELVRANPGLVVSR